MGYYDKTGLIGSWKGKDVVIVFSREEIEHDDRIYVVASEKYMMVHRGTVIGTLTDGGSVIECKPHPFSIPKKKKVEEERGKRREVVVEEKAIIGDFNEYTKIVDDFFKNLPTIEYDVIEIELEK